MTSASDAGSMRPPAPRRGTGGPSCCATPAPFAFESDIKLVFTHGSDRDRLALALRARALFAALAQTLEVLAEVAVPGRDDDRDSAVGARLTREAYERARLLRVDVAEEASSSARANRLPKASPRRRARP